MSTWRHCNTADEDDRFRLAVCRDLHTWTIIHVDILDIARRPRWCSLHSIVREPHMVLCRCRSHPVRQPGKYAPDRVVALDDGLWRGSRLYLKHLPERTEWPSTCALRWAVRKWLVQRSRMSTCWPAVCEWRYDTRFGGFDSMASRPMPSTNRVVDTSTFLLGRVSE